MAEKFTRWNELKSGINPFVPVRRRWPDNVLGRVVKAVVGVALGVLRMPIIGALFLLLALASLLVKLMPLRVLKRIVKFMLESPTCYLCLLFLGFYSSRSTVTDRRRVHLPEDKKGRRGARPGNGDIILGSNSSFVELLFVGYRYCPMFTRSSVQGGLEEVTLINALWNSFGPVPQSLSVPVAGSVARTVNAGQGFLAGPIYVQPEVARSNAKAVLSFGPALVELGTVLAAMPAAKRPSTFTVVFHYAAKYFNPTHTADRGFSHVWWMCCQVYNNLQSISLPPTFDPQVGSAATQSATPEQWAAAARNAMVEARGTGSRAVDFGAADFNEFWEAYRNPAKRTEKRVRTYHGDVLASATNKKTQ